MHTCFYALKEIALKHGYNLVLHGSMDRDLDLVAIAWQEEVSDSDDLVDEFCEFLDGRIEMHPDEKKYNILSQGRKSYVINLRRGENHKFRNWVDAEYYLDISFTPTPQDIIERYEKGE